MADLNTVGFKVDASAATGLADSSDSGDSPDFAPSIGKVTFTPTLVGPTTFLPDQRILSVSKVVCELDSAGRLRPPANGVEPPISSDGMLTLISPQSPDLLDQGWTWTARFEPIEWQTWNAFTISKITGAPGETVVLTTAMSTSPSGQVRQALVFLVDDFDDPIPAGAVPGDLLLETPTMTLGKVVA